MSSEKKKKDTRLRFIVPRQIGQVEMADNIPTEAVITAWRAIGAK